MSFVLRRGVAAVAVAVAVYWAVPAAWACPFCSMQGQTLTGEVNQASMVLFGTLANGKIDPAAEFGQGTTDLEIISIVKKHEILGDKKVVTLPRYVPTTDKDKPSKFLIFCDVFKGKIDPYRGVPVKNDEIVKYLTGALELKDKDTPTRLAFFFKYLDNDESEVSTDAFKEFANADYKDIRAVAKTLPAETIAKWVRDPNTPSFRLGSYSSLLGHCGTAAHATLLRELLDDPKRQVGSGIDGMLAGYIMLQPKEGWEYTKAILGDKSKEFLYRYAALRCARFFVDFRPDVIDRKQAIEGVCQLLEQGDVADLAIEDLRKWKAWEVTDKVLELEGKPSHKAPIVRRAILRFALSAADQNQAKAGEFVKEMRNKDAEWVKDVEEILKLETPAPATPASTKK
jgi:hypothetical protein